MLKNIKRVASKCIALFLIIIFSLITISFSWSDNSYAYSQDIIGKSGNSYFAKGTGTQENPFYISNAVNLFNLAYLQNINAFGNTQYYFKIANPFTDESISIDFNDSSVLEIYKTFKPIGTSTYPFNGIIDGNLSTLANFTINGYGFQDIGVFGYISNVSSITNLFLDSVTLLSNPSSSDDMTSYHTHNVGEVNIATGYVAGHVEDGAILQNIYVISPTINSLSSSYSNRSQYALVGYSESDAGVIMGGPEDDSYSFDLNATNAYNAIYTAYQTYNSYYINGSSTLTLANAFTYLGLKSKLLLLEGDGQGHTWPENYSLSTLKISQTPSDPNPTYLYDQMVLDGNPIGSGDQTYSRENIDIVGLTTFAGVPGAYYFSIDAYARNLTVPYAGTQFVPNDLPGTMLLYVKPTTNPENLGQVTATYAGGGDVAYYKGGVPGTSTTVVPFSASGVPFTIKTSDAFCGVVVNDSTGEMTVVDTNPELYVFIIGVTNGQSDVSDLYFNYTAAALNHEALSTVSNIDFIYDESEITSLPVETNHSFSYLNFGYTLTANQAIQITTSKDVSGVFRIDYSTFISDGSSFELNIINIDNNNLVIYMDNTLVYSGNHDIVEITVSNSSSNATGKDYGI